MGLTDLTVRVISALARGALRSFAAALKRLGAGLKLFNAIRSRWGPLTSQEASTLYNLGQQYVSAGKLQSGLGPAGVVNPQNVPLNPSLQSLTGPGNIVQYHTVVQLFDPALSQTSYVTIFVNSPDWLTTQEIAQEAGSAALSKESAYQVNIGGVPIGSNLLYSGLTIVGIQRGA